MKVSFNGLRKNLCGSFNTVTQCIKEQRIRPTLLDEEFQEELDEKINQLGSIIGTFLCIYEPNTNGDFDDLSEDLGINFLGED